MTPTTVKERIYWTYANLAMAHAALDRGGGCSSYGRGHYMIRARLFKGLMGGQMEIGSIVDDEREKMRSTPQCAFCGTDSSLSVDHLIPRHKGGADEGDNLILACRPCNSSKGKKDLLEWYRDRDEFPPILVLRRYLKVTHAYCINNDLVETPLAEVADGELPFRLDLFPPKFPAPCELRLTAGQV